MWARYLNWKPLVVLSLVALALFFTRGEPSDSPRWKAGVGIAVVLGLSYLTEEIIWILQNRGRPCAKCGRRIHLKPFSLRVRCPHCGHWE
jgi:hypothetical protein